MTKRHHETTDPLFHKLSQWPKWSRTKSYNKLSPTWWPLYCKTPSKLILFVGNRNDSKYFPNRWKRESANRLKNILSPPNYDPIISWDPYDPKIISYLFIRKILKSCSYNNPCYEQIINIPINDDKLDDKIAHVDCEFGSNYIHRQENGKIRTNSRTLL